RAAASGVGNEHPHGRRVRPDGAGVRLRPTRGPLGDRGLRRTRMPSVRSSRSAALSSRTLALHARDFTGVGRGARPRTVELISCLMPTKKSQKAQQYIVGIDLGGTNIVGGAMTVDGSSAFAMRSTPTSAE